MLNRRFEALGDGEGEVAFDAGVEFVGGVGKRGRGPADAQLN